MFFQSKYVYKVQSLLQNGTCMQCNGSKYTTKVYICTMTKVSNESIHLNMDSKIVPQSIKSEK